ncbi:MAG: MFS transporter [Candidatus Sumerlaeaceae bacterium]|nr:MFS transporter [Candidatus Sumerlaeaceae bacterium]
MKPLLPAAKRFRVIFFLAQMSVGIQFPFFVLYLKREVGLSESIVSVFTALSGLAIVLFQQPWGYVADILLPKKLVILTNLLISGALFCALGQLSASPLLLGAFFVFQIFSTPIIQLLHGLLFVHHGSDRWFGTLRAYASLGFVVANMATGIIADRFTSGRLTFIFPLYLVANVLTAAWILTIPESRVKSPRPSGFWDIQRFFFSQRSMRWFLATACIYQLAHSLSYSLQSVLMVELGADMRLVSGSYSLAAVLELPVFFGASRLIARHGAVRLMVFCAAVQAVRWLLVWQASSALSIIFISSLHCITFGLFYAAAITYANDHAPPELKASAQTLFALVYFGIASLLSNLVGGLIVTGGPLAHIMSELVKLVAPAAMATPLRNLYIFSSLCALGACVAGTKLARIERVRSHSE